MIYILMIVAYLAIGGVLAGIFEDLRLDEFVWYLLWPFMVLVYLIILMEIPFERVGSVIRDRIRLIKNRNHK